MIIQDFNECLIFDPPVKALYYPQHDEVIIYPLHIDTVLMGWSRSEFSSLPDATIIQTVLANLKKKWNQGSVKFKGQAVISKPPSSTPLDVVLFGNAPFIKAPGSKLHLPSTLFNGAVMLDSEHSDDFFVEPDHQQIEKLFHDAKVKNLEEKLAKKKKIDSLVGPHTPTPKKEKYGGEEKLLPTLLELIAQKTKKSSKPT